MTDTIKYSKLFPKNYIFYEYTKADLESAVAAAYEDAANFVEDMLNKTRSPSGREVAAAIRARSDHD